MTYLADVKLSDYKFPDWPKSIEPMCSKLAYNPDRRWEFWRFVTYAFMHANTGKKITDCSMHVVLRHFPHRHFPYRQFALLTFAPLHL